MTKIAWVTDSTASLDDELRNHPDVYVVPMTVVLDGKEYTDGIDLTPNQLYESLESLRTAPKTSQPSIGAFRNLYEELSEKYDQIIGVFLSSKLSGTVSSSEQASQLGDFSIVTIDSKILSYPLTRIIKKGMEWIRAGVTIDEVKKKLEDLGESSETYVLVGSLEQLHRSGRMSGIQFLLGSMLNVKPIISIQNGALSVKEKARSAKKAKEKIAGYLRNAYEKHSIKEAYLLYGLHEEEAENWKRELEVAFSDVVFKCYPLGATVGVHAGEHTLGISWLNNLEEN